MVEQGVTAFGCRTGCSNADAPQDVAKGVGDMLRVENIDFSYGARSVLKNVSFTVKRGEICGLLGPNGCGKTTLFKCINGILEPKGGSIILGGRSIKQMRREEIAKLIAVVPQELHVVFGFTVLQMVIMGGTGRFGFSGIPKESDYVEAYAILEELGIAGLAGRRYNELSGGEKQMVLIARAIFQKADIMLLDEPTSHLDFKRQYFIMETVKRITAEKGLTTIITLHDPNTAGRYCTHLVMLNSGCVCHCGEREAAFNRENLESTYNMKIKIEYTRNMTECVFPDSDE
ncbi:MAG: ABC transporter ATP-binding protein [Leptospirales bacterium]|nr:ABC transporter ATP-binding protein [Leptospirales bacterium]